MKELIEKLNDLEIIQKQGSWAENLPDDIWKNHFEGKYKEVEHGIGIDTHRWYETSISVIEINGEYLGIRLITNMFSESQEWEDCFHTMQFYEMEKTTVTTFKRKI